MRNILLLLVSIQFISCWDFKRIPPTPIDPPVKVMGYVPIYAPDTTTFRIYADTAMPVKNAGKIYVKDNLIFQNDLGYGIHVIDKSEPAHAKRIGFIHLAGNLEISIQGNYLYGNSYGDLVVVDISNWHQLKEVQRLKNAFQQGYEAYRYSGQNPYLFIPPPERAVYYQCIDTRNGILTGWMKDSVYNNGCFYN